MKNITVMLKPASSLCDLRCKYCFYADVTSKREVKSFGVMRPETVEKIIGNLFDGLGAGDGVTVAFQGGEPTLAGLDWFRAFVKQADAAKGAVRLNYALQTNAVLLDDEWAAFLTEHHFLTGVSLDGPADIHDLNRVDTAGKGTYKLVMHAIRCLERAGAEYNILVTLTNTAARHPEKIWKWIVENNFRHVQFTPCLAGLGETERGPYALTPARFASFYTRLFPLWEKAFKNNDYYSVKLFDDLINLLAFGEVNACGLTGHCTPQFVAEADGGVYPCDFYMLDEWKAGDLTRESPEIIRRSEACAAFVSRPQPKPLCAACPYAGICGGNCPRMRESVCYAAGDRQCGYRLFLDSVMPELTRLAQMQRGYRR